MSFGTWFIIIGLCICLGLWLSTERRLLPYQSTREFWRLSDLPFGKKVEGYFYAARAEWYLKPATWSWFMRYLIRSESADTYHGKMLTRQDAVKLVSLKQPVHLEDLDQVIPYPVAKSIILQDPLPSLAVVECPCRAQKADACMPRDVCLAVGEPYASFIVDHQPDRARRITVEQALDIIAAEEERGHIHTAWFKDAMHNRFYVICNCCPCCCLGMKSYFRGVPRLTHSGYSPQLDPETCLNCSICESTCPFKAISAGEEFPAFDLELCMGCGLCTSHCPSGSLQLILTPEKGFALDIENLSQATAIH